ncbi:MAG: hypothetical protein E7269_00345 [Lachnospiraceae bacterium]|nr:hypothetical protein [Lachnospiraceae bacterium]
MKKRILSAVLAVIMVLASVLSVFAETSTSVNITGAFNANSGDEALGSGDFDVTYTFTNKSLDTSANWNNFAVELFDTAGNFITMRADCYGVGAGTGAYNDDLGTWGGTVTTTWTGIPADWAAFRTTMANANVTVNVVRTGNVLTFTYDIVGASTYHIVGTTPEIADLADELSIHLSGEKVTLENITFTKNERVDDEEEGETVDITAGFSAHSEDIALGAGDFDVTYTFTNKSKDTTLNYANFAVELFDTVPNFVTMRADCYGVGSGAYQDDLGTWGGTVTTTWTGVPADDAAWATFRATMADADVTVNVVRTGNVLTFTYDIVGASTYHIVGTTPAIADLADELSIHLSGEQVKLTNITFEKKEIVEDEGETVDITAGFSAHSEDVALGAGDFDVTYTFTNKSKDTTLNYANFAVELFDTVPNFVTMRADCYGVGSGAYEDDLGTWGGTVTTTWTGIPTDWDAFRATMADADVTVNVVRTGNVLTFTYDIVGASTYHIVGTTPAIADLADELSIHLSGEQVKLSNIVLTINEVATPVADIATTYAQKSETGADVRFITEFSADVYDNLASVEAMGVKISKNGGAEVDFATEYVTESVQLGISGSDFEGAFASIITNYDKTATYELTPYYTIGGETVFGETVTIDSTVIG